MRLAAKTALLSAVLVVGALCVRLHAPASTTLGPGKLAAFPAELAGWESEDERFDDVVYRELEADGTLLRRYTRGDDESVWLVIVYYGSERYGAHDPRVCYTAQDWTVDDEGLVTLAPDSKPFDANWMRVRRGGDERAVLYWWCTAGEAATADRDEFMGRMTPAGIRPDVAIGAFVRISAPAAEGGFRNALSVASGFAEAVQPEISRLFVP